jgi:HSP20 family molecular chaperone IbpA
MPNMVMTARRDPFAAFDTVIRRAFPAPTRWTLGPIPGPAAVAFSPAVENVKDGDDALVRVDLPGVDLAKDVTVELDRGRLVIRGERRDERVSEATGVATLRETRYGSFRRVFTLPERVGSDAVSATYDAGVLSVRVTGAYAAVEPQKIAVTVSSVSPVAQTVADSDTTAEATSGDIGSQN